MGRSLADVIVVGGGISGLTCAFWLARAGLDVRVIEAEAAPGGCIRTLRADGFLFDLGPTTLAFGGGDVVRLCDAAGLTARLRDPGERANARFVLDARRMGRGKGGLAPLPSSPMALATTPLLSLRGKARALGEPFVPPREGDMEESVADFMRRRLGDEFLDRLVVPFVAGILAGDPERMSIRWALPALHEMEARHGSLLRGALARRREETPRPRPVSFEEGLCELPRAITSALGDRVLFSARAETIDWTTEGFEVAIGEGLWQSAPHLVLATPAPEAARLVGGFAGEKRALAAVEYAPIVSLALGFEARAFRRAPEGFGYLAGRGASRALAGCLYTSSLFPDRAPEGHVALTVLAGGTARAGITDWPEDRILNAVMDDLRGGFGPLPEPVFRHVTRWPRAIPQYNLGHGRVLGEAQALERSFPGLHLAGAYLRGPSLADCVAGAGHLAQSIMGSGTERRTGPALGTAAAAPPL